MSQSNTTSLKRAKKRLLMVVPFFPPVGGIASLRATRFARHLPDYGWEPIVVTRKASRLTASVKDLTLLKKVSSLSIFETGFLDLAKQNRASFPEKIGRLSRYYQHIIRLIPPDPWVGWLPFAYRVSKRIMAKNNISAILTQSPPLSTNLVGYALKRRTGVPWIADLLDEWTHHPGRKLRYRWQVTLDKRLEKVVLQAADEIVVTTPRYREVLTEEWGPERGRRVSGIALGYDREDFEDEIFPCNEKFTLAFVGSLDRLREDTFHEFRAVVEGLIQSGALDKERFRFRFVGHVRGNFRRFDNSVFGEVLEGVGHLPHKEAVNEMRKADALLLIRDPGRTIAIPGKTFEYMAAYRPILALTSREGATASLLQSCKMATIVDPRDGRELIAEALVGLFQSWQNKELDKTAISEGDFDCYEAATLTRSLARRLDEISMA